MYRIKGVESKVYWLRIVLVYVPFSGLPNADTLLIKNVVRAKERNYCYTKVYNIISEFNHAPCDYVKAIYATIKNLK